MTTRREHTGDTDASARKRLHRRRRGVGSIQLLPVAVSAALLLLAVVYEAGATSPYSCSTFHKPSLLERILKQRDHRRILLASSERVTLPEYIHRQLPDSAPAIFATPDNAKEEKQTPLSFLCSAIPALLQDPKRLVSYLATGCQIGLIFYMVRSIWKAASEIVDELNNADGGESSPSFAKSREQVHALVAFLEQEPSAIAEALTATNNNEPPNSNKKKLLPSYQLLQLAQKLLASGMPLRSSSADSDDDEMPSVESLLLELTRSEGSLLMQCLWTPPPAGSDSVMDSVAGLDVVKERLLGTLQSMQPKKKCGDDSSSHNHHHAYASLFASSPSMSSKSGMSGVLLYGPPGCGKTLLVKALASFALLPCLVISPSALLRKYVGDTNLQVRSLFSLASKLAPCILCIDELDGLFRERSSDEHEVSRDLKTEFLQYLDGMMTDTTRRRHPVLVVGATNRPFDVDSAILRRLPQSHFVGLPDAAVRQSLLAQLLRSVPTEPDLDLQQVALQTEGYSPSDLRQVLQTAALTGPMQQQRDGARPRGLTTDDILQALDAIPPTPLSEQYSKQLTSFARQTQSLPPQQAPNNPFFAGSKITVDKNGLSRAETLFGNFYNVGTLEIDSHSFDVLSEVAKESQPDDDASDFENSDDDGF